MKHNVGTLLGVVSVTTAATLLGVGEAQAVLLIDDFSTSQTVDSQGEETISASGVFAGFRGVDLSGAQPNDEVEINSVGLGAFSFDTSSTNPPNQFREARLVYAGGPASTTSVNDPANSNLPLNDAVNFLDEGPGITFRDASGAIQTLTVNLYDSGSGSATTSLSFTPQATPQDIFLSFANFSLKDGPGPVNDVLSAVRGVEVIVAAQDGAANPRFEKIEVTAVPFEAETSAALLLLGSWGAWKYFKKRNQQKVQLTASDEN